MYEVDNLYGNVFAEYHNFMNSNHYVGCCNKHCNGNYCKSAYYTDCGATFYTIGSSDYDDTKLCTEGGCPSPE